jgi:hypothetical protein
MIESHACDARMYVRAVQASLQVANVPENSTACGSVSRYRGGIRDRPNAAFRSLHFAVEKRTVDDDFLCGANSVLTLLHRM